MATFGRIAWIGHIWLTALATLVAGIPHFACRCPDGHVKPICIGTLFATSGCCCGGTCCSSSERGACCRRAPGRMAAEQLHAKSCCQHQVRQTNGEPAKQREVGPRGCTRTVAPAEVLTRSPGMMTVGKDLTAATLLPQAIDVVCLPKIADADPCWQSHQ